MSKNKQNLYTQMFDGIVHTTHHHLAIDVIAGCADDENVTDSLVEKQFNRHSRIRTSNHSCKRSLMRCCLINPFHVTMRIGTFFIDITLVSCNQFSQCLLWV